MSYPKASEIGVELLDRLYTILDKPETSKYIRFCVQPNPTDLALYNCEEGVNIIFGGLANEPTSGAGRYGMKASRIVTCVVNTRTNLDSTGGDKVAAFKHLDLEETIINALIDRNPNNIESQAGICFNFTGAGDAGRFVKRDPTFIQSALTFDLLYPLRLSTTG